MLSWGGGGYSKFSTNLVPRTFTGKRPGHPGDKVGFIFTRSRDLSRVVCGIILVQFRRLVITKRVKSAVSSGLLSSHLDFK